MGETQTDKTKPRASCEWERFLEVHGDVFFLFARQLTRTESDAKDITQQVMMDLWSHGRGEIPDRPLVFLKLRRKAIDLGRSKDRRSRREQNFAARSDAWFIPNYGDADTAEKLQEALQKLPEKLREVVVLRIWGDLAFPDIATTTGVSVPTASSRFRYGLEQLRKSNIINELRV